MNSSAPTSSSQSIICPSCEASGLRSGGHKKVQCTACGYAPSRGVLGTIQQIITLPDALGKHACEECGHPEMRHLPDGVSHCPGCGSEVLPTRSDCRTQAVGTSRGHRQFGGRHSVGRTASTEEVQPEARDASSGRRQAIERYEGSFPASDKDLWG